MGEKVEQEVATQDFQSEPETATVETEVGFLAERITILRGDRTNVTTRWRRQNRRCTYWVEFHPLVGRKLHPICTHMNNSCDGPRGVLMGGAPDAENQHAPCAAVKASRTFNRQRRARHRCLLPVALLLFELQAKGGDESFKVVFRKPGALEDC